MPCFSLVLRAERFGIEKSDLFEQQRMGYNGTKARRGGPEQTGETEIMIVTVTLNPAVDKTAEIDGFAVDTVNRVKTMRKDPGGKGINVSKVVASLGGQTTACGILGGAAGDYIRTALEEYGVIQDFTTAPQETRTNLKIIDRLKKTNTDINETGAPADDALLAAVFEAVCSHVQPGDTVVFAGKNPPATPDDLLARWTRELKERRVKVFVDTVGVPMQLAIAQGPTMIKPNGEELAEIMGRALPTRDALLTAGMELIDRGVGMVVISMGGDGALFVTQDARLHAHGVRVPVGSTVGAGDSMTASVAFDLERGLPLAEIARNAVAVSAANVMCSGTQPAEREVIAGLIDKVEIETLP